MLACLASHSCTISLALPCFALVCFAAGPTHVAARSGALPSDPPWRWFVLFRWARAPWRVAELYRGLFAIAYACSPSVTSASVQVRFVIGQWIITGGCALRGGSEGTGYGSLGGGGSASDSAISTQRWTLLAGGGALRGGFERTGYGSLGGGGSASGSAIPARRWPPSTTGASSTALPW